MSNISLPADTYNLFPANPANHMIRFARMPHLSFMVQEVNLPTITANVPQVQSGGRYSKFAPDRLNFEPLTVTFLVDEEYRVHRELYRWLWGVTGGVDRSTVVAEFIEDEIQYLWPGVTNTNIALNTLAATYAGLTILNPAKIPILRVLFYNLYITSLGGVQFLTTGNPEQPLTATATFEYEFYTMMEIRR
jgi:hypothetical protein